MSLFPEMLHHSAPERSLSIPFSGLWFLFLDLRNVSRTRPGASGDVSSFRRRYVAWMSPGCRRDVAWMSPGFRRLAELSLPFAKKIPGMRFFRQNSVFSVVTNNVRAIGRVRYL